MNNNTDKISLKNELKRKAIHLFSSVIPLSYFFLDRKLLLYILGSIFITMVFIDILRFKTGFVREYYHRFLGDILRDHETKSDRFYFTGGTYIILAFLLCILIFEKNVAILSMLIIVFCDTAAAITGRLYGKNHIGSKTIEGSIAFFITGLIIFILVLRPDNINIFITGVISLLLTTVFELIPVKIDDNITIPLVFGIIISLLTKTDFLI